MDTQPFYRVPVEIWEKIIEPLGRQEIASLACVSRRTHPVSNHRLYKCAEISFCKCSEQYLNALERTMTTYSSLAELVETFMVDMSITCRVKECSTSLEDLQSAKSQNKLRWRFPLRSTDRTPGSSREVMNGVRSDTSWHNQAMQALQHSSVKQVLGSLPNLRNITIILGRYYHEKDILRELLGSVAISVLHQVQSLKLRDLTIAHNPRMSNFTSLTCLDLGYVTVINSELCMILASNAHTLQDLRLCWIMEASQNRLLESGSTCAVPLPALKTFRSQGPHGFDKDGLTTLFSGVESLQGLHLESLAIQSGSVSVWADLLVYLVQEKAASISALKAVSLGAPINSELFWAAGSRLLCSCGSQIERLSINGSPKGTRMPFPQSLKDCFAENLTVQPKLKDLNLIWRDDTGVDIGTIRALPVVFPSVEHLHLTMSTFSPNIVESFLDLFKAFNSLRSLHLVFPIRNNNDLLYTFKLDILHKRGACTGFITRLVPLLPMLRYLSLSVYEYFHPELQPSYYIEVKRPSGGPFSLRDLGKEYIDYKRSPKAFYRSYIGDKKVQFSQKPSWREYMGNPLAEKGLGCIYTDYIFTGQDTETAKEL